MRKELNVSEEQEGRCDQDVISEEVNTWRVGRHVARVGGRARSWDLTGSHDNGAPTSAGPWIRSRDERHEYDQALRPDLSRRSLDVGGKPRQIPTHLSAGLRNTTIHSLILCIPNKGCAEPLLIQDRSRLPSPL